MSATAMEPPKNPRLVEGYDRPMPPTTSRAKPGAPRREYRCDRGHLLIRATLTLGSEVECYCDRCRKHVVFIAA